MDVEEARRTISRHTILKEFYFPEEGLWRIPLSQHKGTAKDKYGAGETVAVTRGPAAILRDAPPPPDPQHVNTTIGSVYELRTQPQLARYFHAAAGFPTKPTWLAAIRNGHYSTWPGLTAELVERHYPESIETRKGHARKIKMNLRSTKKLVEEEEADRQLALNLEDVTSEMGEDGVHHRIYNLAEDMDRKIFSDQLKFFCILKQFVT